MYAHVVGDPAYPGRLALQYWMFYVYNDWNNLHEGDWEMIQLNFDAASAAQALDETPVEVGYSQHTGGERAGWGDDKLEIVGGSHPVVYPASGSHAGFFDQALYLGGIRVAGGRVRRHPKCGSRCPSGGRDDPQRQRDGRCASSPGSRSRGGGASSSRPSSTAPRART